MVERIAITLKTQIGEDNVFYDAWSIRPGDGIIQRMNEGLTAPDYFFYFISNASSKSGLVDLEWQSALFSSAKGNVKFVPVRVDNVTVPAIINQVKYIDLYSFGLEAATKEIIDLISGNSGFKPQHTKFSNITYSEYRQEDGSIKFDLKAEKFAELHPAFYFIVDNKETEVTVDLIGFGIFGRGFETLTDKQSGETFIAAGIKKQDGPLLPGQPWRVHLKPKGEVPLRFRFLMHVSAEQVFSEIPKSST